MSVRRNPSSAPASIPGVNKPESRGSTAPRLGYVSLLVAAGLLATLAMALLPTLASAQGGGGSEGGGADPGPSPARIELKITGLKGGKAKVGDRVEVVGTVTPFVGHQRVEVRLGTGGDTVLKANPYVRQVKGKSFGRFKLRSGPLLEPGHYRARARKADHRGAGRRDREVEALCAQVHRPRSGRPRPGG